MTRAGSTSPPATEARPQTSPVQLFSALAKLTSRSHQRHPSLQAPHCSKARLPAGFCRTDFPPRSDTHAGRGRTRPRLHPKRPETTPFFDTKQPTSTRTAPNRPPREAIRVLRPFCDTATNVRCNTSNGGWPGAAYDDQARTQRGRTRGIVRTPGRRKDRQRGSLRSRALSRMLKGSGSR